jgi:hypothetical protein
MKHVAQDEYEQKTKKRGYFTSCETASLYNFKTIITF